mgnify:CR=1 FL=1
MFQSCLGQLLFVFVVLPMLIVLLWKTGILAEMRPALSLVIDAVKDILTLFIQFLQDPNIMNQSQMYV